MSDNKKLNLDDAKKPEALSDDMLDQIAGGTGDGTEPDGLWNGAILLPEIPDEDE